MITDHDRNDHSELPDLTALDCAVRSRGDRSRSRGAQRMLTRILDTPRVTTGPASTLVGHASTSQDHQGADRSALTRHRTWVLTGLAAALTAVGVVLPTVTDGSGAAFASWTPTPSVVPLSEAASWQEQCLAAGADPQGPVTTALSERRGQFTFALMVTDQAVGTCLLLDQAAVEGTGAQERGAISWGPGSDLPTPTTRGATVQRGATFDSSAGEFTSAFGRAGEQVAAVRLTPDGGRSVQATLEDGYFTAWWPGPAGDHLRVTLTHLDGTTSIQEL